jgi:nanoRNase/pAp phosphatase (c-di-AMP/oligoRNAs hydrolase)
MRVKRRSVIQITQTLGGPSAVLGGHAGAAGCQSGSFPGNSNRCRVVQ